MKVSYPVSGAVSVWVGTFYTKDAFDSCVDDLVEPELGLTTDLARFCEVTFERSLVRIEELLHGFSRGAAFCPQAISAADGLGLECANAALVCFNLSCEEAPELWGELHFLGTFSIRDESAE